MARESGNNPNETERPASAPASDQDGRHSYCSLPRVAEREFGPTIDPNRASLIRIMVKKWVNGTVLHYYFLDEPGWATNDEEEDVVRRAFDIWKALDIGLQFEEVDSPSEAEVRVGFMRDGRTGSPGAALRGHQAEDRSWPLLLDGIEHGVTDVGEGLVPGDFLPLAFTALPAPLQRLRHAILRVVEVAPGGALRQPIGFMSGVLLSMRGSMPACSSRTILPSRV